MIGDQLVADQAGDPLVDVQDALLGDRPQRARDHSMPSMLITFGIALIRCRTLKTAVL